MALKKIPTLKVYKKEDIPEIFHLKHNRRIQPILIIAKEGYTLCDDNHACYETGIFFRMYLPLLTITILFARRSSGTDYNWFNFTHSCDQGCGQVPVLGLVLKFNFVST